MMKVRAQSGFSLIEALVAFMIISIGMLGIASLQTISMKAGHTAVTRTAAIFSAQDILDRMRANRAQLAAYAVDAVGTGTDNNCHDSVDYASQAVTAASACTAAQLAADDIFRWKQSFPPNISGAIDVAAPTSPRVLHTVTVTISWTERVVQDTTISTANSHSVVVEM